MVRDGPTEDRGDAGGSTTAGEPVQAEPLIAALRTGRPLSAGLVAEIRDRLRVDDLAGAQAMAATLRDDPATESVGAMCFGIVAFHQGYSQLAWAELASTPRDLWSRFAVSEYVRSGLDQDPDAVLHDVRRLLSSPPAHMNPKRWMDVLEPVFGAGAMDLARELFDVLDAAMASQHKVNERLAIKRDWMRRWINRSSDSPTAPKGSAEVSFAVVDYDHPGRRRASANIGDHVQTLASLGHLVRHQELSYEGPQDLLDLTNQLRTRVRPEMRRDGHTARVQLLTVDRDATTFNEVPPDTWMLAFGWYMHAIFGLHYAFPFHKNLNPIFVSFHCNKRSLLTPEAIEYLRERGPVGCRDWTTVDILLSVDVPAYFSGCITTTINTVFPDLVDQFPGGAPIAYVDVVDQVPQNAVTYRHSYDDVRFRSFTGNMFEAVQLLETYRREHSAVVTSRLHCYLPMRSIGARVDFRPKNRSDIRFAGLIDIGDEQFDRIRSGINARLESVFDAVLTGASTKEVYALWRELCAPDVEDARRRLAAPAAMTSRPRTEEEIGRVRRAARSAGSSAPDRLHVAVPVDRPNPQVLAVLVDSLARHAGRPLHIWLLDNTTEGIDLPRVALRAPGHEVTVLPTRGLGAGLRGIDAEDGERTTHALEVLALPELLPEVDRVAVLPWAAVVAGDVGELLETDLAARVLAAPDVAGRSDSSGFGVIHNAASRLGPRTAVATELRRQAHARHAFDFTAFDADVLVMDLARLRADDAVKWLLALVEEFGLDHREALHMYVGPNRTRLPDRWHVVPTRNRIDDGALYHWLDAAKPWTEDYAPEQARWYTARALMRERLPAEAR